MLFSQKSNAKIKQVNGCRLSIEYCCLRVKPGIPVPVDVVPLPDPIRERSVRPAPAGTGRVGYTRGYGKTRTPQRGRVMSCFAEFRRFRLRCKHCRVRMYVACVSYHKSVKEGRSQHKIWNTNSKLQCVSNVLPRICF